MDIYIANLSANTSITELWDIFSEVGIVREVEIVRGANTSKGKDFAIVQLEGAILKNKIHPHVNIPLKKEA